MVEFLDWEDVLEITVYKVNVIGLRKVNLFIH